MTYNVLFISHERKMGGANRSLTELASGLRDLGVNVSVVVLHRGCPIDRKLRDMGIETFPCFFGWWQQPRNWSVFFKIAFRLLHWLQKLSVMRISQYVRKHQVNIIHSNSSAIDIGAQVAERTGCKHVWHFREYGEADYCLEYIYGRAKSIGYVMEHSDMVIFISNALREYYKQFARNEKVRIIYNGIYSEKKKKIENDQLGKEKENHTFTFLVTGNIIQGKNQKLVAEAVDILVNQMKVEKNKFQVYFAGAATALAESKKYRDEIRAYIDERRLDNIIFTGYVDNMDNLRKLADAEIVPSKSEAYGRVTLEAMISHNLVIASNSGANPELIGEDERGLLFESNNASDLAMKMMRVMNENTIQFTERAFEYVKSVHVQEEAYRKVQKVYQYILEKE